MASSSRNGIHSISPAIGSLISAASNMIQNQIGILPRWYYCEIGTQSSSELARLAREVAECRRCPRLVAWREQVAREKRAAFAAETYWGRPVPGFGDPAARVLLLGLAPAAHGANRTGRMFTGDRSGDFLYAALHRTGFANQPLSIGRGDGLRLTGVWITAAVRCAPPANRPTPAERDTCLPWGLRELVLLARVRVIVCLGGFAWAAALRLLALRAGPGAAPARPRPRFEHGAEWHQEPYELLGCYHPSQQNTFTGRLTEQMLDAVLERARLLARPDRSAR
jgi:uracil-DNA glycosylase